MPDIALIIIARAPERGRVKTRLAKDLGDERTLLVYRHLLERVAAVAGAWPGPVGLLATGAESAWGESKLRRFPRRAQPDGSLGARIAAALRWGLDLAPTTVAIGTDCPGMSTDHLARVAAGLGRSPVAFGPALDGGYWAIAVDRAEVIPLVGADDLPWSCPDLLTVSEARLHAAGFTSQRGPLLGDCDTRDDLVAAVACGLLPDDPIDSFLRDPP